MLTQGGETRIGCKGKKLVEGKRRLGGERRGWRYRKGSQWAVLLHEDRDAFLVSSAPSPFAEEYLR